MKKPSRNGIPRYAIRIALIEIREDIAARMLRYPDTNLHICFACARAAERPYSGEIKAAAYYIRSFVQYALGRHGSIAHWARANNRLGRKWWSVPEANAARLAWLDWMIAGIEAEIEKEGQV